MKFFKNIKDLDTKSLRTVDIKNCYTDTRYIISNFTEKLYYFKRVVNI